MSTKQIVLLLLIPFFDGAEVCELFGSYILQQLSQLFEHHQVGLYRDDGLAILKGYQVQKLKE